MGQINFGLNGSAKLCIPGVMLLVVEGLNVVVAKSVLLPSFTFRLSLGSACCISGPNPARAAQGASAPPQQGVGASGIPWATFEEEKQGSPLLLSSGAAGVHPSDHEKQTSVKPRCVDPDSKYVVILI